MIDLIIVQVGHHLHWQVKGATKHNNKGTPLSDLKPQGSFHVSNPAQFQANYRSLATQKPKVQNHSLLSVLLS